MGISASREKRPWSQSHGLVYIYASIPGGVVQQPLLVAERAKAPLVTQKSRSWHWKLHCKDCVNSQCEEADHSGHTSRWDLSPWAVSFWVHAPIFHIFSVLCIQFSPFLTLATVVQKRWLTSSGILTSYKDMEKNQKLIKVDWIEHWSWRPLL